jgi:HD-like signal output (HDOD) protein
MAGNGGQPSKRQANFGRGQYQIEASEYMLSPQAMVLHLRKTLASPSYKPPLLPTIALDLMQLTRRRDVSVTEVRQLLERDPLLAANVLKLAQSALYSPGVAVRSLDEAITRLGLRTLGDVFLQTVLSMRVFRADGYDEPMAKLMRHSTLTAHVARIACRMTSIPDEYAFMCGLFHDAGVAVGLLIFADSHVTPSPGGASRAQPPKFDEVAAALYAVHEEASAILAETWRLHADIRVVLGSHHRLLIGGRVHPLAAAVCVSDWIATQVGAGFGDECNEDQTDYAVRSLGFTPATLDELTERARGVLELL